MRLLNYMKTAILLVCAALMCCAIPLGFALLSSRAKPRKESIKPTYYHIRTIAYDKGEYIEL